MKILKLLTAMVGLAALSCCMRVDAQNLKMLHVNGRNIVNSDGNIVHLHGTSLGGWFLREMWLTPINSSGNVPDNVSLTKILDSRFGVATEQSLLNTYQDAWITSADLDNIQKMGCNLIRIPVAWEQFEAMDGSWRSDAFNKLDWVVSQAAARGIYSIIDLHGAPGGVSPAQSSGDMSNSYWTSSADQAQTSDLWTKIATHYNENTNVLGYDLLNETDGAADSTELAAYASLYNTVRAVDPNHIVIIEGMDYAWGTDTLPDPGTKGWTNTIYEIHPYDYNNQTGSAADIAANIGFFNWEVQDEVDSRGSWNIPIWAGEFNVFNTGTSTWQDIIDLFNSNNIPWTWWTYKACNGTGTDSWGLYNKNVNAPPVPNLQTDSAATIQADWAQWTTANAFTLNPMLAPLDVNSYNPMQPYNGTPASIPGTIPCVNYDLGGENYGYHDSDSVNSGGLYRNDDVDMGTCSDTIGNGYCVGWTNPGEYLNYTVNVAAAGTYTVNFRVASGAAGGTFHLEDQGANNLSGPINAPATGDWQKWTTVTATVILPAGQQLLKLYEDTAGYNLNVMGFVSNMPPSTSAKLSGTAGNNGWYTSAVMVTLSVNNPNGPSDLAGTFYTIDGGSTKTYSAPFTVSGDGTHTITYWSTSTIAGSETVHSQSIKIDATAPTTTQKLTGYKMNGAWVGGVTATLYPVDATSGVFATYYAPSSTNIVPYTGPFFYGSAKTHTWSYWSVDNAGNSQKPVKVTAIVVQPLISSLSQTSVKPGNHRLTITVNGNYFISGAKVTWNGTAISTTYVSQTQLTAIIPGVDLVTKGNFNVQVVNPNTYGKTNKVTFTVN